MPSTRNPSTSSTNQGKKEEGINHLIGCTGTVVDGNGCVIWTNVWVTQVPKNFFARPFLCGFCAFEGPNKASRCTTEDLAPIIEADSSSMGEGRMYAFLECKRSQSRTVMRRWLVLLKRPVSKLLPMT